MGMNRIIVALLTVLALTVPLPAQVLSPNQAITVVDSGTACVTAPTACAIYALDTQTGGLTISVAGTWTGTLTFEGTNNDGTWTSLVLTTNLATGVAAATTTVNGLYAIANMGVIKVRVRATAAITGSAIITAAKGLGFARAGPAGLTLAPDGSFTFGAGLLVMTNSGAITFGSTASEQAGAGYCWLTRACLTSPANGAVVLSNNAQTIGSEFKADALPTIGAAFGTSPSVTAGSTPLAGSVNVGTGGVAVTGTINFNGTAYPSAPFCTVTTSTTNAVTRATPTTTTLVLNSTTAWTASDIVSWICISSK